MKRVSVATCIVLVAAVGVVAQDTSAWLAWSAQQAERIGKSTIARGRIGGGRRLLNTERAFRYELLATWMTPDVIRASARLTQLNGRLTRNQTEDLVREAEQLDQTIVMVELDPDEGSGVIPLDWQAFLQPGADPTRAVAGTKKPAFRDIRALAGVLSRNYDYDRFWVAFPLRTVTGEPLFLETDREAELSVRINDREGRLKWPIPDSLRR